MDFTLGWENFCGGVVSADARIGVGRVFLALVTGWDDEDVGSGVLDLPM
jgi:hypothetical protein